MYKSYDQGEENVYILCPSSLQECSHYHKAIGITSHGYFGPVAYVSIRGNKYGFVIVDDYSQYTWVFFMKDKSKVHEIFKKFATRAQNEFDMKTKRVKVTMAPSSRKPTLKSILMKKALVMSSPSHILHNKMG
jgi:hypothetical protein